MSKSDFEFFYIVQRQKRKLPNWVLSTFGLRHTMGELLPIASRGNSGSQTRLNAPDQEAKAPLTTRGCWGGTGRAGSAAWHTPAAALPAAQFPRWVGIKGPFRAQSLVKFVYLATNTSYEVRVLRQDSVRDTQRVCCFKNKPYCQGLACKFLPNLAKNYGRAGSILLLS